MLLKSKSNEQIYQVFPIRELEMTKYCWLALIQQAKDKLDEK
jgi:hypothetical protein